MMMAGRVDSLFTSASDGDSAPMTSHASVECIKGVGIAGDRYAVAAEGARFDAEQNTHWHLPEVGRQLTLFDTGALQRLEEASGLVLPPEETRRNVLVSGLGLNELVGQEVALGEEVVVFVHRLTVPCQNLERRTGLPGLEEALWHDGGLNCEIVSSGVVKVGDAVTPVANSRDPGRINTPKIDAFFVPPSERTEEDLAALAELNATLAAEHAEAQAATAASEGEAEGEADEAEGQPEAGGGLLGWVRGLFSSKL